MIFIGSTLFQELFPSFGGIPLSKDIFGIFVCFFPRFVSCVLLDSDESLSIVCMYKLCGGVCNK